MFLLDSNVYIAALRDREFDLGFERFHREYMPRVVMSAVVAGQTLTPEQASSVMLPLLFALLLLMPLLMAYWFAPVLVGLNGLSAADAMKLSFKASLRNMLPMLAYSVIIVGLMIVAIIPFGLGLLVVIPTMMTSLYTSYQDIFVEKT